MSETGVSVVSGAARADTALRAVYNKIGKKLQSVAAHRASSALGRKG